MLRLSKILLESRSARSKILAVKLACSLEPPLGLNYRVCIPGYGGQVQACSKLARLARKLWLAKLARSLDSPLGLNTNVLLKKKPEITLLSSLGNERFHFDFNSVLNEIVPLYMKSI